MHGDSMHHKQRLSVTVDADVLQAVERTATALRLSVSSLVNQILARSQGIIGRDHAEAND